MFVRTLSPAHGMTYIGDRENLFDSVVTLYQSKANQLLNKYPLRIRFAKERAIDAGGVSRDMFSAFHEEAYERFFDRGALPYPIVYPTVNFSLLPMLGTIISHGYLTFRVLPA